MTMECAPLVLAYVAAMTVVWRLRGTGLAARNARILAVGLVTCAPLIAVIDPVLLAAAVALTALADIPGHGDWIDHGTAERTDSGEWANRLFHWLTPWRDGPLHDSIGMFFSGALNLLPIAAICALAVTPWALLLIVASGAAKAAVYRLAWVIEDWPSLPWLRSNTEWAEALRGPAYAALILVFVASV